MEEHSSGLGEWLKGRYDEEGLSLRQVANKTGVSHQTIAGLINGKKALPQTIKKLAEAFGGNGINGRLALEDRLLVLAGYRTPRPREKLSEPLAKLMDKVQKFDEPRLKMMLSFADFLVEIDGRGRNDC